MGDLLDGYTPTHSRDEMLDIWRASPPSLRHAVRADPDAVARTTSTSAAPPATGCSGTAASPSRTPGRRNGPSRSIWSLGSSPRPSGSRSSGEWRSGCARSNGSSPTSTAAATSSATGVVPRRLVVTSKHYHRAVAGIEPPGGVRVHVAGHRPRARRRRPAARARGQRAHAVGHLVRRREPAGDDARVPRAVRVAPRAAGCRLPVAPARGAVRDRARSASRTPTSSCSRPACTTPRTSSIRSSPARWASSSSRAATSFCRDNRVFMRTTARRRAGARRLPPHRRRVPRPAALPLRLDARLRRARERGPRRQRDDRELRRQRCRRRQGDLPVRAAR